MLKISCKPRNLPISLLVAKMIWSFNYFLILNNFVINLHPLNFNVWMKNFCILWFHNFFVDFEGPFSIKSGCKIVNMLKYAYLIYYIQGTAILVFSHSSLDTKMRQNTVDDRKWKNDMGLSFSFYLENLEKKNTSHILHKDKLNWNHV